MSMSVHFLMKMIPNFIPLNSIFTGVSYIEERNITYKLLGGIQ